MKRRRRHWKDDEAMALRLLYPDTATKRLAVLFGRPLDSIYGMANKLGLSKSAAYLASEDACRLRRGDNVGAPYRFKKGHVPPNKGLRRPGWGPGRMKETQFKKGQVSHTWRPVGDERIVDGYRYTKVSDTRNVPWTRNWFPTHVLLWEKRNGKVPRGHALAFLNGDKADIRLDNLELITRRELMRRNSVHNYPKAIVEVIQLRGALQRQINKRSRAS